MTLVTVASRIRALLQVKEHMKRRQTWEYVTNHPWCSPDALRSEADDFLQTKSNGAFLVYGKGHDNALAVRAPEGVLHYPLDRVVQDGFACLRLDTGTGKPEPVFNTIEELIAHYQAQPLAPDAIYPLSRAPPAYVKTPRRKLTAFPEQVMELPGQDLLEDVMDGEAPSLGRRASRRTSEALQHFKPTLLSEE
eukprot:m.82592 g.82592  ORF g.82592 m.82592 type:complete len:193 (+) comp17652_c0_seq1:81-659(+)